MAKFSLKSLTEGVGLIYITPLLVLSALFHIFNPDPAKHHFGQMELIGVFLIMGYVLWSQIPTVYDPQKVLRKRIESCLCLAGGILSLMILIAPLLTWQFVALYRAAADRATYMKPVAIAIITIWIAIGLFFYGTAKFTMDKMQAANASQQESTMPTPEPLPQATQ